MSYKNLINEKLEKLKKISEEKDFWKDQNKVKKIVKEKNHLENIISSFEKSKNEITDLKDFHSLGLEEKNEEILSDCNNKIKKILIQIKKNEVNCFLSGENDIFDIYLEIHAGAGGTESQDWAEMLRRMYLK